MYYSTLDKSKDHPQVDEDASQRGETADIRASLSPRINQTPYGDLVGRCGSDGFGCPRFQLLYQLEAIPGLRGHERTFSVSFVSFDGVGNTVSGWTCVVGYYDYHADMDGDPFEKQTDAPLLQRVRRRPI